MPIISKIKELRPNDIVNAIIGADKGYEKILELVGVGFRAAMKAVSYTHLTLPTSDLV